MSLPKWLTPELLLEIAIAIVVITTKHQVQDRPERS